MRGVPFEDVLLTGSTWEKIKPTTPWGQVPVLEVDGQQLGQSGAINSYVGRELGLYPAGALAAAKIDEFCDTVEECSAVCLAATYGKDVRRSSLFVHASHVYLPRALAPSTSLRNPLRSA